MMELLREAPLESGPRVRGAERVAATGAASGRAIGKGPRSRKAPTAKSIQKTFLSRDAPLFDDAKDSEAGANADTAIGPGSLEPVPSAEPTQRDSGQSEAAVPAVVAQSPGARSPKSPQSPKPEESGEAPVIAPAQSAATEAVSAENSPAAEEPAPNSSATQQQESPSISASNEPTASPK